MWEKDTLIQYRFRFWTANSYGNLRWYLIYSISRNIYQENIYGECKHLALSLGGSLSYKNQAIAL